MKGIDTDETKKRVLPLLLTEKTAYFADVVRTAADWTAARELLEKEFNVDHNVIIGELRVLRCVDYDVNKFSE